MGEFVMGLNIALFLFFSMVAGRFYYYIGLRRKTSRILRRLDRKLEDLHYSLEHLIYFISVPNTNPQLLQAKRDDLYIRREYDSLLFPTVSGLQIYLRKNTGEDLLVAHLTVEKIGFPQLSVHLHDGRLTIEDLKIISAYKSIQPQTIKEILDEVYDQMR